MRIRSSQIASPSTQSLQQRVPRRIITVARLVPVIAPHPFGQRVSVAAAPCHGETQSLDRVMPFNWPRSAATTALVAVLVALAASFWSVSHFPFSPPIASSSSSHATMSTFEAVRTMLTERGSLREYAATPVPDEVVAELLRLTQRAPTAFNTQPYVAIIARSDEDRARLAPAMLATNQIKVTGAPLVVVFAADLEPSKSVPRLQELMRAGGAPEGMVNALPNYLNNFSGESTAEGAKSWSYKQTAIAATTFLYAATAKGLATCPMEGFDQEAIKKALGLSDRYSVPIVISVGYAKEGAQPRVSGRRPPTEVFFEGQFGGSTDGLFETK